MEFEVLDIDGLAPADNQDPGQSLDQGQAQGQQQPAQAAPVVVQQPYIDPQALAAEITQNVMNGLRSIDTPNNQSAVQQKVGELLKAGWPEHIVQGMMSAQMAVIADTQRAQQSRDIEIAHQQFANGYWSTVEEVADAYIAKFPQAKVIRDQILTDVNRRINSDPQFASEARKVMQLRLPSKQAVAKATAQAIDGISKSFGLNINPAVGKLDANGARPVGTASSGNPLDRLDSAQRKQYFAFKKTNDGSLDQKAYDRALRS